MLVQMVMQMVMVVMVQQRHTRTRARRRGRGDCAGRTDTHAATRIRTTGSND